MSRDNHYLQNLASEKAGANADEWREMAEEHAETRAKELAQEIMTGAQIDQACTLCRYTTGIIADMDRHIAGHEAERQNDRDADELARYIELRAEVVDYMTSQSARGCRSGGGCDLSYRSCSPCWADNLLARIRGTK